MSTLAEKEEFLRRMRIKWYEEIRPFGEWIPAELRSEIQLTDCSEDKPYFSKAPQLGREHLRNCKVVPHRLVLLEDYLPKDGRVVEVGTDSGAFAERILELSKPRELHLIDLNMEHIRRKISNGGILADAQRSGELTLHESDSAIAMNALPREYFDWIYIDAQHSYEGVKRDIEQAIGALKPDGLLVFNDYIYWSHRELIAYGVVHAVNELCVDHGWEIRYLALSTEMYNDVALSRI